MKVGIIGSGGREHAISHAISQSKKVEKIYCFPGNAGTEDIAENVNLNSNDFDILKCYTINEDNDIVAVVKKRRPNNTVAVIKNEEPLDISGHYKEVENLINNLHCSV